MRSTRRVGPEQREITVEGVSKKFRKGRPHDSLRDLISDRLAALRRPPQVPDDLADQEFWALRDVTFSVGPGEVLGIVGPNGSGKSTLLKLLTGIMEPTRGMVRVTGRVGALIELAAGFHGELSGAENVYLQGSVMGIDRAEIGRRFDEIVDFAGVGDFIDTPVKRYSSGMLARLGFSIAAHMDPDALLVDEVLSVGDHAFQRKAEARLREMVERRIPVVVVSHRLESITAICDRAILLHKGSLVKDGSPEDVIAHYVDGTHLDVGNPGPIPVELHETRGGPAGAVSPGDPVTITVQGTVGPGGLPSGTVLGFRVWRLPGETILFATHNEACGAPLPERGPFSLRLELSMNVGKGLYRIQPCVWDVAPYHEWVRGPSVLVEVREARAVMGAVNFAPRMEVGTAAT